MSKVKWTINIYNEVGEARIASKSVRVLYNKVLALVDTDYLPKTVKEIGVYFVDGESIKVLNHGHRGKKKVTDVLSFPMVEYGEGAGANSGFEVSLGDVVICLEQAFKQHREFGTTKNGEVVRLLIHGLLHILGYDHENVTAFEAGKMRSLEASLFELLGKTRVYSGR